MLKCGFYETDITPHIGGNMPGYGSLKKRVSDKVTDPLYAHAFAASAGGQTIIILSLDILSIEKTESDRIRSGLSAVTGIPAAQISVAATHNHTGGATLGRVSFVHKQDDYCDFMVKRAIDAGYMAVMKMEDAKIGAGSVEIKDLAFSRRFRMKDGSYETNPGVMNPEVDHPVEPVDNELLILRVDRTDGSPMGVIVNFALHPDSVGTAGESYKTGYSADYPGVVRKYLRKAFGPDFSYVFLLGACGNVNHLNVFKPRAEQKDYRAIGTVLAEAVLEAMPQIETKDIATVKCTNTVIVGKTRRPTWEEVDRQKNIGRKKTMLFALDLPDEEVSAEVWTAMVGDTAIQMLPGELFAYFGLEMKKGSPCGHTMVCEQANDAIGYIYTKEAEQQGGYEPCPNLYTKMNSNTGYQMVEAALDNIAALKEDGR